VNSDPPGALDDRSGEDENPVIGWARAVVFGIRDTAGHMLEEGRRGAREAREDGWERFDEKTRNRRKHD